MIATDALRGLVNEFILTPDSDKMHIDVRGDLAGILAISLERKKPAGGAGPSQFEMVVGVRFQKYLPLHRDHWHAKQLDDIKRYF